MANSWFQFKKFKVNQDRCAMKISTDAVMLGALVQIDEPKQVLEIGTGTGVISLMLAQRFESVKILGVEIDADASQQGQENFEASPFRDRLSLEHTAIQDLESDFKFDVIVSNPPYFPDHLKPKAASRQKALHTDSLSFLELAASVHKHLAAHGDFWMILPSRQMQDFEKIIIDFGLIHVHKIQLADRPEKPFHREIACFSYEKRDLNREIVFLKTEKGSPSARYQELLAEFFLDF